MSDDQNQRSEFDDFLVVLRRLQKATPAPASIEAAETASMDIQAMIHKGVAMPAHLRIRAQLEERLYGWGEEVESNAVEVHVHNLRKKLGADAIRTIRGVGYVIARA